MRPIREYRAFEHVLDERHDLHCGEECAQEHAAGISTEKPHGAIGAPRACERPTSARDKRLKHALRISREQRESYGKRQAGHEPGSAGLAEALDQPEDQRQEDHRARERPLQPTNEGSVEHEGEGPGDGRQRSGAEHAQEPVHADAGRSHFCHRSRRHCEGYGQNVRECRQWEQHGGMRIGEKRSASVGERVPQRETARVNLTRSMEHR